MEIKWSKFQRIASSLVGRDLVMDEVDPFGSWRYRGPISEISQLGEDYCYIFLGWRAISHKGVNDWVVCNNIHAGFRVDCINIRRRGELIIISSTYVDERRILPRGDNLSREGLQEITDKFFEKNQIQLR